VCRYKEIFKQIIEILADITITIMLSNYPLNEKQEKDP